MIVFEKWKSELTVYEAAVYIVCDVIGGASCKFCVAVEDCNRHSDYDNYKDCIKTIEARLQKTVKVDSKCAFCKNNQNQTDRYLFDTPVVYCAYPICRHHPRSNLFFYVGEEEEEVINDK